MVLHALHRLLGVSHLAIDFAARREALDTLADILGGGKSSRLYKSLVYEKQIAQQAAAFHPTSEISGTFQISVTGKAGTTPAQLEEAIKAELARTPLFAEASA